MANPLKTPFALSLFDQLPFMRSYTQMLLCFPLAPEIDRSDIVRTLQQSATKLLEAIPSLAGQAENHKDETVNVPNSGTFRVVPYNHSDGSPVRVKMLDDFMSYEELRKSKVPASLLDEAITAPMKGLPHHPSDADVTPAFIVQANFIPGGLLLDFSGMHNLMDATGLGQIIKMFAAICRMEAVSEADIQAANCDRAQLDICLKHDQPTTHNSESSDKPEEGTKQLSEGQPPLVWFSFSISAVNLDRLKEKVLSDLRSTPFRITTNDVLTAWVWKAVTKARSPHIDTGAETMLMRAISGRKILNPPLPPGYVGNVVNASKHKVSVQDLIEEPLSKTAQGVREATNLVDDHAIRTFASTVQATPDRNKISFDMDAPDRDFLISSWAALPVYQDFGSVLGRPELVRRPTGPPWNGVCYILPKNPDGSLDVLLCLRDDDMRRMRDDEQFKAVAEYIG
ncbi:MAG: hypothetical protein Q9220_005211 [cf. Caloplaca sp. 1 TL-2023]